ncbi:MAG: xylulokinase [Hyphomicrobiales bacterium]
MYLGLDIGTSAVKAVLTDRAQRIVASASVPLTTSRPRELWSEQNPDDWWQAAQRVVAQLREQAGADWRGMKAIGLSGQMHGTVLLDRHNRVIRPAILWNDGRAHAEAAELRRRIPGIGEIAGVPPMAGSTAPKLLWLRQHEPDSFAAIAKILLPKDYVRLRLTGSFATDMCDAAGSLLFDTGKRQWSKEIVAACGLPLEALPPALEGNAVSGHLRDDIARFWGLEGRIAVAAGAGDAAAGAIGIGAVDEGDGFISLGTSAQYFVTRESYRPAPASLIHTFCHGLPGRWFQMAALLNGAGCLSWVAGTLGEKDVGKLLREAEAAFAGPSPLIFLPYLTGERTPHNNPHAKGVFFGLTPATRREDMVLAVLEGVALALADCQTYLAAAGPLPQEPGVIGGGSKSALWMRILAAVLDRPLVLYETGEAGSAFGAARLARLAHGSESVADICKRPNIAARFAPGPELARDYAPRLEKFRALYRALAPLF